MSGFKLEILLRSYIGVLRKLELANPVTVSVWSSSKRTTPYFYEIFWYAGSPKGWERQELQEYQHK